MAILGVDVDLTVVDSDNGWWAWMNHASNNFKFNKDDVKEPPYNLCHLYLDVDQEKCNDYWRQRNLYDNTPIKPGCYDVLKELSRDNEIVFVTALKGDHHKSKVNLIKREFPFWSGIVPTHEKEYARLDVHIDDRLSHLNEMVTHSIKHKYLFSPVLFKTKYQQGCLAEYAVKVGEIEVKHSYNPFIMSDWNSTALSNLKSLLKNEKYRNNHLF